jgi:hypothetical protein
LKSQSTISKDLPRSETSSAEQSVIAFDHNPSKEIVLKKPNTLQVDRSKQSAIILIIYQDEQQREITQPQLISGKIGEKINFRLPDLSNYNLINAAGFCRYFFSNYAIISLIYRKKKGGPLLVDFIDFDSGSKLHKSLLLQAGLGEAFQVYPFEIVGYTLISVDGKIKGFYTTKVQQTTIYYRRKNWDSIEKFQGFLDLHRQVAAFKTVEDQSFLLNLPAKTKWKIFHCLIKKNQEIWFDLGAFWVKYVKEQMSIVKAEDLITWRSEYQIPTSETVVVGQTALIDFVLDQATALFDYPNGNIIGKIKDRQKVKLAAKTQIDGIDWYQLQNYGWIPSHYVKISV